MREATTKERRQLAWQHRGRCLDCGLKIAGCRRVRRCLCGSRVVYR